jgi:ELWxxDGT repeat protein
MVKNLSPGFNMINIDSTLFFEASTSGYGSELWKSDGTADGTVMVRDINPPPYGGSNPSNFTNVDSLLYFTANHYMTGIELWKSNGTWNGSVGTDLVKDIYPGPSVGSTGNGNPSWLTNVSGTLFFSADDGTHGRELWKRTNSTYMVKDITPGAAGSEINAFRALNGKLVFEAGGSNGYELWVSDGTESGTHIIKDICPGACSGFQGY